MMLPRLIPTLLLEDQRLVKTVKFKKGSYIGDPINAIKLFNELEVDEIAILDIKATERKQINFSFLERIASECFVPLAYGGGISCIHEIRKIFAIGFEKVILNTQAYLNPELIAEAVSIFGSQSIVGSLDYRRNFRGSRRITINNGTKIIKIDPVEYALELQKRGCGELLLTSIDHEGSLSGMDFDFIDKVSNKLKIPVIAVGGARSLDDWSNAVKNHNASAVAAGSMFVYHGKTKGILINYPTRHEMMNKFNI